MIATACPPDAPTDRESYQHFLDRTVSPKEWAEMQRTGETLYEMRERHWNEAMASAVAPEDDWPPGWELATLDEARMVVPSFRFFQ